MFNDVLSFHVVASAAKSIGSAVVSSWGILYFKFVLPEELGPAYLSSVKNLGSWEV